MRNGPSTLILTLECDLKEGGTNKSSLKEVLDF
jgi:hypothetical protein